MKLTIRQRNLLGRIRLLLTMAVTTALAGCAAITDRPDPAPVTFKADEMPSYSLSSERLTEFKQAADEQARKSVRNHYIVTSVVSISENYDTYKRALQTQDITGDIGWIRIISA
ncbi:MAG: hypothetical protein GKR94_02540 [Gammaproteobacteria bacterium]|nr:hypothetical protein [Gammaproteobacteria bacterium]